MSRSPKRRATLAPRWRASARERGSSSKAAAAPARGKGESGGLEYHFPKHYAGAWLSFYSLPNLGDKRSGVLSAHGVYRPRKYKRRDAAFVCKRCGAIQGRGADREQKRSRETVIVFS